MTRFVEAVRVLFVQAAESGRPPAGAARFAVDSVGWADAWMNRKDYAPSGIGMAHMLNGDAPDGGASNVDPFAAGPTADNQWVVEGPHVMLVVPDAAMLESVSTDPENGGPYVMWKGTPYAHIMMPVGSDAN